MSQSISLNLQPQQNHSLKQMQRLIMSSDMQQAICLMQLPIMELSQRLESEIALNPILEYSEENAPENEELETLENEFSNEKKPEEELLFDDHDFEILKRLENDLRDISNDNYNSHGKRSSEEEKLEKFKEESLYSPITFFEHLMAQAHETFESEKELKLAEVLIGNFDGCGFLKMPLSEVALLSGCSEEELELILKEIQRFEPNGVGARSLQESMLIQLENQKKKESLSYAIIANFYDDFLHNRIPLIQKALKCSHDAIIEAIQKDIRLLDLHPGAFFSPNAVQPIVPDATILYEDGKLTVIVNEDDLPSLCINRRYLRMLDDKSLSLETKEFIKQKIVSAKWFMQNIHHRSTTINRIVTALTKRQRAFFTDFEQGLEPLTMKTIAEELSLHESTVARAVSNKYLNCPRGLLPLRSFFTTAYVTNEGKDISSQTVRQALLSLIKQENSHTPLSDESLSQLLKKQGITCARRTIAKYRTELNIANAHQRKKFT